MRRRQLLRAAAAATLAPLLTATPPSAATRDLRTPEDLVAAARAVATRPHVPAPRHLQSPFDALTYDSYRGIRPRLGRAGDLPLGPNYRADLLPPGWLFREPVGITLPGHETAFATDLFDFDPRYFGDSPGPTEAAGIGFSGLRLRHPLNDQHIWDEVLVLQGASYFRALARGTVYGLSARALALGTGGPVPEEFPATRHISVFSANDDLQFGCLVDSPRCSAALIATLSPGAPTRMECALHLFPRVPIADAGIAPLTSMFQHNAVGPAAIDDFRPAVHDSDTLVIDNGAGERLWRPISNPARLQISSFVDTSPSGFGLMQMANSFADFRDQEGAYHLRPSAWVTPRGAWGPGAVMLLEIPTANEFADNVVAFWRPDAVLEPGAHRFDYRLDWCAPSPAALPPQDHALLPMRSASGIEPNSAAARLYVIDFVPPPGREPTDPAGARLDFGRDAPAGVTGPAFYPLDQPGGAWRASFVFAPEAEQEVAELRLRLRAASGEVLAPVWLHRWTRSRAGGP
ncbi:glucan biosynthesis protein [Pararhodobacter sp. SW119]|uniref:glucan biosynthesis protein n=1 Tax=Pararhodobacter sp. SW119 TaxID=2780075 RepID=UPI001ADEF14A|nr:glucan biosynthesis protein [Pararhodobacter sp. SW119]